MGCLANSVRESAKSPLLEQLQQSRRIPFSLLPILPIERYGRVDVEAYKLATHFQAFGVDRLANRSLDFG